MYTIVMVESNVVVHSHVNLGNDLCTIVMVERNVVVRVHVNMGNDVCTLLLWLNVMWLYIAM